MTTLISKDTDRLSQLLIHLGQSVRTTDHSVRPEGSASQLLHLLRWNSPEGIRLQAHQAGVIDNAESTILEKALEECAWQEERVRHSIYCVVNLLFQIRRYPGFNNFERAKLEGYPNMRPTLKTSKRRNRRRQRRHGRLVGGGWDSSG